VQALKFLLVAMEHHAHDKTRQLSRLDSMSPKTSKISTAQFPFAQSLAVRSSLVQPASKQERIDIKQQECDVHARRIAENVRPTEEEEVMGKGDRGREAEATLKKDEVHIEVDARESQVGGKEGYRGEAVTVLTMPQNLSQPCDCRHCTKRPKDCLARPLPVSCLSLSDECKQRPHVRDDYTHQLSPSTPTCNPHPTVSAHVRTTASPHNRHMNWSELPKGDRCLLACERETSSMQIGGKASGEGVGREAVEGRSFQAKKKAAQTLTAEILEVFVAAACVFTAKDKGWFRVCPHMRTKP
jgi:hypothetical protein